MPATATIIQEPDVVTLLLSIEKACRALDVSESTLRRLPIPHVKVRGARRYAVADLQAWIDANKQQA